MEVVNGINDPPECFSSALCGENPAWENLGVCYSAAAQRERVICPRSHSKFEPSEEGSFLLFFKQLQNPLPCSDIASFILLKPEA